MFNNLYLVRHGEAIFENLTPNGHRQAQLAAERWSRVWDRRETHVYNSPEKHTRAAASEFTKRIGVPSIESDYLLEANFADRMAHLAFARLLGEVFTPHVVLIGHDETRRVCEAIVFRYFERTDVVPYVPIGGLLRFTELGGYELL